MGTGYLTAAADPPESDSFEGLFASGLGTRGLSAAFTGASGSSGGATPSAAKPKELMSSQVKSSQKSGREELFVRRFRESIQLVCGFL